MKKFAFWRFSVRKNALKHLNRMLNKLDSCHGASVSRPSSDDKLWVEIGRGNQQFWRIINIKSIKIQKKFHALHISE
jgi:hypothetical protein